MKKKKITPGKKDGRPKTTVLQRVKKLGWSYDVIEKIMQFGLTDKNLAFVLGISEDTITRWKKDDPDFLSVLKQAKETSDAKVVRSLYERASGYEHPDVHISNYQGVITKTEIIKRYPPDATSMIFWLKNRQGWVDKQDFGGFDDLEITVKLVD